MSDSNGQTTADAVRFVKQVPPQLVAKIYYAHNDHLGTPQRLSDESGTVAWAAQYDPFGAASVDQDPDGDGVNVVINQRFPGQYYDEESGLHYNMFRDYDPEIGRYITSDPIGLEGGTNTYGYVGGNPVNYTDPSGLKAINGLVCYAAVEGVGLLSTAYGMIKMTSERTDNLTHMLGVVDQKINECDTSSDEGNLKKLQLVKIRESLLQQKADAMTMGMDGSTFVVAGIGVAVSGIACGLLITTPL